MRTLMMVALVLSGCSMYFGGDDAPEVTPDAGATQPQADAAPICDWQACGEPPDVSFHIDVTGDGETVSMSVEDYERLQQYRDTSATWASCRRYYDEMTACH